MGEQGYNGWSNYETWAVALWIDNEQQSQAWALELAREFTGEENGAYGLGDLIQAEMSDAMPDLGGTVWADLLGAAFSEVDWQEIGEHYLSTLADVDR